jgi:hypothetical protein
MIHEDLVSIRDIAKALGMAGITYQTGNPWSEHVLRVELAKARAKRDRGATADAQLEKTHNGTQSKKTPHSGDSKLIPASLRRPRGSKNALRPPTRAADNAALSSPTKAVAQGSSSLTIESVGRTGPLPVVDPDRALDHRTEQQAKQRLSQQPTSADQTALAVPIPQTPKRATYPGLPEDWRALVKPIQLSRSRQS